MSLNSRISYVKELVAKTNEEDGEIEITSVDSNRSKAIKFLNALETVLHQKFFQREPKALTGKNNFDFFYQIMKAREYLSQPGSSAKSLMESVALVVPKL